MQRQTFLAASLLAAVLAATGCASMAPPKDVADTIAADPQLSTLNKLVDQAGLRGTLKAAGPFTVFAPTDEAFKAVPAKTLAELQANPAQLKAVLEYHVLPAKVAAADAKTGNAKTVNGANVAVSRAGTFVTVEDAMVQQADRQATNGVVHVVDRVLMPPRR